MVEATYFDAIKDAELKTHYSDFIATLPVTIPRKIKPIVDRISTLTLKDISWELAIDIINNPVAKYKVVNQTCATNMFRFIIYLSDQQLYQGKFKNELVQNRQDFGGFLNSSYPNKLDVVKNNEVNPLSFIQYLKHDNNYGYCVLKKPTPFLWQTIKRFLNEDSNNQRKKINHTGIFDHFVTSLGENNNIESMNDFSDETFFKNFKYFSKEHNYKEPYLKQLYLGMLCKFYIFIIENIEIQTRNNNFKIIDANILKYTRITDRLQEGYRICDYSVYEEPPTHNRMILKENGMDINSTFPKDTMVIFSNDFVKNPFLQNLYTQYFWKDQSITFLAKTKKLTPVRDLLIQLDNAHGTHDDISLSYKDIYTYVTHISTKQHTNDSVVSYFSIIKGFLHFIDSQDLMKIDTTFFSLLTHKVDKKKGYKESYTKEQIAKLKSCFRDKYEKESNSDRALLYKLYFYALELASISEMRLSSILALEVDSLFTDGTDYKLFVNSKSKKGEKDDYIITNYIKKIFEEIVYLTRELRTNAEGTVKNYIFIYRRASKAAIARVRQDGFEQHLQMIFDKYNIDFPYLPPKAIRNYYQQQVSEYIDREGYNPMLAEKLGKHSISIHAKYYDKVDIKEVCYKEKRIEIGNIHLAGKVETINKFPVESTVENGCGHCSLSKCNFRGNLNCFMCKHFVATLDCIDFYELAIEEFDYLLNNNNMPQHEKESIIQQRRIHLAYLNELKKLTESM